MSDSPPATYRPQRIQQRKEQTHSGSFLDRSGHETDQPSPSVVPSRLGPSDGCSSDRKMSSLLQPPPAPLEGSQRMHDKVASFLQDMFIEDALERNDFSRDCAHVGSLSNAALLRIYWFAQGRLVGIETSEVSEQESGNCEHFCVYVSWHFFNCNGFLFFQGHVLDALGVTDD
jgi:hypothetical protein